MGIWCFTKGRLVRLSNWATSFLKMNSWASCVPGMELLLPLRAGKGWRLVEEEGCGATGGAGGRAGGCRAQGPVLGDETK